MEIEEISVTHMSIQKSCHPLKKNTMKQTLLLIFILSCAMRLNSQNYNDSSANFSLRYKGGQESLREFIALNIDYPLQSMTQLNVGLSISSITITPNGSIEDISIINSIDQHIDKEVMRLLKQTKSNWFSSDTITSNQVFYVQIALKINDADFSYNYWEAPNILEPVSVVANIPGINGKFETDVELQKILNAYFKEKKYHELSSCLDELIRRNPYNKKAYQLRIMCNSKTGNQLLVESDTSKLLNFINNQPL